MDFSLAVASLSDEDAYVRIGAIRALGNIGDVRVVEPLIGVLRDGNADVRYRAVSMLQFLGDKRAVGPLIAAIYDEDQRVGSTAAYTLGVLGDKRAVGPLIATLSDEDIDNHVRHAAADALGILGDKRALESLIVALYDEDMILRLSVERTLEELGELGFARQVAALRYGNEYNRRHAAQELGKLRDSRAVELLIGVLLYDKDIVVRSASASALGEIGDVRAVKPLIAALYDEEPRVRSIAAEALGKLQDVRAVEPLAEKLKDEGSAWPLEYVYGYAAVALESINTPEAHAIITAWRAAKKRPHA